MRSIAQMLGTVRAGARMVAGVGCYEAYLTHMWERHPAQVPMTNIEYFRDRQDARFGGGTSSCC